jgi:hypothetical protein
MQNEIPPTGHDRLDRASMQNEDTVTVDRVASSAVTTSSQCLAKEFLLSDSGLDNPNQDTSQNNGDSPGWIAECRAV